MSKVKSRDLQKLLKYFNGTTTSVFTELLLARFSLLFWSYIVIIIIFNCIVIYFNPQASDASGCKLNISSFLTLPHLLDFLICTRNSVSIVLLLWMMGGWNRLGVGGGGDGWQGGWFISGGGYYLIVCFFLLVLLSFVLSCPVSFFKWAEHDSCCVCFFVYHLFPLSLLPLTRSYWGIGIVLSLMWNDQSVSDHYSVDIHGKGGVF